MLDLPLRYPGAERLDLVEDLPAADPRLRVADPYRWLEDPDDPRTRAWSAAQDELFAAARATWPGRDRLARRVGELLAAGSVGPPVRRGQRRFSTRRDPGRDHPVLLVAEPDGAGGTRERVLVDPLALDPAGLTTLDSWSPSLEGDLLAYQLSEGGREESALRVLDVATGEVVDGPVDRVRYSPIAWLPGGERFYLVRRLDPALVPEAERQYHRRVWLHRVGTDPAGDVEVFGAGRPVTSYYGVAVSRDGRWLSVSASVGTAPRTDVWLGDLAGPGAGAASGAPDLVPVAVGLDAATSAGVGRDGRLYVHTDLGAPRGRLAVADPTDPGAERWRDLLPERPDAVLEGAAVLDGAELERPLLLAAWSRHALSEVTVHDLAGGEQLPGERGRVRLPGPGSVGGLHARPEGGHEAWFTYTDPTTLPRVLRYDARTGAVDVEAVPPGGVRVPPVLTRQLEATSADGTTVRMLLIAPASAADEQGRPREPLPTVLYGYGGFGLSLTPGFSASALAWVEAGGAWVSAGLRGGAEEGEEWHRAGMLGAKQNVFDDFAACADALVAAGWTTPRRLAVSGGSNGGLLVGAALTQRPESVAAVLCSAPLLDMVRYQLHGLGATWAPEYGDATDPEHLAWLHAYSPYHAVREGTAYPAVLFTVFDGDTRVDPLHARKTCAALQHATTADPGRAPVLLRREADVGHGARAVSRTVELTADALAFAAACTGLELEP
ncbi:prolyl oligopeptidase family protein [Quadrisphaera sp. DSM 44207]|uniref:prolyl oligopeptidase family serine peptidase n=1 Tax=Quadrisphaera sp. DSM 44207 TaxID=1881057 RepID=UPI00088C4439|nr:prolyl oligopeptidase family serine peptidase [Quadrisphaera sp. DSM 44207]SDQ06262.1 prolyl oligopeptidase Serine peptidase. MEROPS family S09A [Quadrisphaera sp. DSM 44207]